MGFVALHRAKLHYIFENIFHVVERLVSEKEAKMNKIFKVIWSKSKQCYVVVSEMAKNKTGKKKIIVASILAAMMAGQAMQVEAYGSFSGPSTTKGIAISAGGGITASANGNNSVAIGGATANQNGAIAIGSDTSSSQNAVSIGWGSTGSGYGALVFGTTSEASHLPIGNAGRASTASSDYAVAVGAGAQAGAKYSMAFGTNTTANGESAVAMGYKSNASSQNAVSIGSESKAQELNALAIGTGASVDKQNATAVGSGASVTGHNATAVGNDTKAKKQYDNAFGYTSTASGGAATAVGYYATASGNQTVALGSTINSTAQYATGIGYSVNSEGEGSVAIGAGTDAFGVIPAKQVKATAKNAIAIGRATQATSQDATAIGTEATASNTDAVAIGRKSNASGSTSIGLGYNTKASDTNTVAIGTDVSATAESAIALGRKTTASGLSSTAVGPLANASGKYSSAFGMSTSAANEGSLALGNGASATVDNGVALGSGSKANVGSGTAGFNPHASRNDPYTNLSGNTLTSTWGAVAVGDGTNTRQITGVAAGTNDTDAVNVAQLKALNLAFTTDGNAGDVNLTNTLSVNGDTDYIATSGGTGQLTISGKIKDISVDTNGTATASKGLANAANVAAAINDANAAQTIKYKANGTGSNSVKLSDGLNFTNGNTTTATVGANGQVSFDLNTATKQSITDSATAVARTISLGGDTGTTTAKSLTSGNVNFGVKSGSPTYLTTTANGNDVTLTINEQAIKNAAKDASSFKVKANATAAEDVKGGDTVAFNDGDNIAITQTGKTFKIATAKNVTFDAATIGGNTTIGSTGITTNKVTVGTVSIDGTNGINAGNKAITNVGTGRVANSNADDTNVANIGDVKAIATDAVANLSTNLGITDGTTSGTVNLKNQSLKVVGTGAAKATVSGQTITVDVAKGTLTANSTTGALTGTTGVVDANDMATAVNTAITKAVDNATGTQTLNLTDGTNTGSVKLSTQRLSVTGANGVQATVGGQGITIGLDTATKNLITNSSTAVDNLGKNTFTLKADSTDTTAQALNKSGGLAFKVAGDGDLVSTSATADTVKVTVKKGTLTTNADGTLNKATDGVVTADNMTTVVNDAITKAVTSAKDGSAWNISTNGGTATKVSGGNTVDLINGDNIEITQDGTDGKKITVKTKKDLTVDSVTAANTVKVGSAANLITLDGSTGAVSGNTFTAGNASMNTTGFRLTGGPSITTAGIDAGSKQITNMISGGTVATNAATIGDVDTKVGDAINNLTTNLTKNVTIAYTVNGATAGQTVSLKDGFNFSNGTLTTAEVGASGVVKFNVTQGTLSTDTNGTVSAGTAGVATTADVASAVNSAVSTAVNNATGNQKLDISAGGTDNSVNLKTQKLTVAGTGAATASLNGQTITVDVAQGTFTNKSDGTTSATAGVAKAADVASAINNANTALSQKITDATTSLGTLGNNTFTLKADSTDTTAQALNKSGGLAFKVAGDGDLVSTSATTDTVKVTVKKGTLTTNADGTLNKATDGVVTADNMTTVVNDAITKAVTSAKDGSAWNISTNGGTATKVSGGNTVDLINGDNIEITQDGTDGKKITVKTKKDLTVDSVTAANTVKVGSAANLITLDGSTGAVSGNTFTAGNASMNTTGFRLTGGPSVTTTGIDAGNTVITNVASGGTTSSNAANIGDITKAISDLTTNLTKNTNIAYTANTATPGQTVSLKDGFNFTNGTLTTAEVAAGGVVKFNVTQGALSTDTNGTVSAGTAGVATTADVASAVNSAVSTAVNNATSNQKLDISAGGTDSSVNLKTQKLTVTGTGAATTSVAGQTITVNVAEGTLTTNTTTGVVTGSTTGVAKTADVASAINNANTALSKKITDAAASVSTLGGNTFTLKADSTDTTAQALNKSGGLAFKVAGDSDLVSTTATADTVKVTVKKGTLTTNADGTLNKATDGVVTADNMTTVVNDAITKAVTSAKDGSAWNISTNGGTATKVSGGNTVDLINGDNIEITQDSTDGKKITVKTKKDLTVDSVTAANTVKVGSGTNLITLDGTTGAVSGNTFTAGNASMNTTGFRLTGGPSVTTAGIDAGGKQITNMISGGTTATNAATIGDVNTKVATAINDLTTNLTKNTNIAYTANGAAAGQTVSLKDGFNFTNGTLTTAEVGASGVVKFNVTQGALTTDTNGTVSAGTPGVATTADVASAVNSAVSTAVNNATSNQKLDISAGGTDSSVNLKTQKLKVAGTGAATASLNNQTITIDVAEGTLTTNTTTGVVTGSTTGVAKTADVASAINNANTALSKKITDAAASVSTLGGNTFTLKADSTDTTAQALNKSGGLAFKVAGDSDLVSTTATADTVKVTVKKGTLTTNADGTLNKATDGVVTADNMTTVVNDAITKAVTSAKDGSAWNISTNGGTATKVSGGNTVDLINGDNIEITQDGTDGKKITVKTKKDLTVDSVTAANTVKVGSAANLITLDGSTGAVSGNTFTAGNASMNTTGFHLTGGPSVTTTGIDAGNKVITNVASGGTTSTNAANIGDITKAISDLTTNLTKNTSISYTANTATPGQTVSLKDGFNFTNGTLTTAEVAANGVVKFNVTQGSLSTDGNGNITNTAGVATTDDVKNAVNTAINKAVTNSSTAVNTLGANTFTLKADSTDTTAQNLNKSGGLAFKVAGDGDLVSTSATPDTVKVTVKKGTLTTDSNGNITNTAGVATTDDVKNAVSTAINTAVTKATGSQVLNITDGTNNGSINLKNDALKVVGTDGVTTEVSGKTITVGLDAATKNKINNASTAANRNISLAADSGTTSSQSLKDGDVSFAVKGASGDYISTNMNGSTVEISTKRATINSNAATGEASVTGNDGLATAKNVADAINAATAKAVSQSAWKLAADGTTGTETISGGDTVNFKAGSNMEVSRTGKDITYKTKDNVAFTTVTAGTGANEVKLDGNTGTVTAKDITATGDVTAKNVTTSGNVTAAGTVKGDTVQGNTVKAGNVTITGGTTNTITGLSNTTWTGSTTTPDRAATEGQLQQAISSATSSATFKFDGDNNSQQTMNLQNGTFKVTGDTMITTNATSAGIGLSLNTNNVKIAYAANGLNGQTTSIASGFNFTDGNHTKATVGASGVVKYDAKTSTISVANGHATASGNDLATADNVADAINQMTQNNAGNTTQLRQEISKVATETQRVGAHAAAMAALKPIQYDPLAPTQIMAGVGNYRGESAAALGIAHYTNDNTMFNVGVSVGGNHNMINAGVTHKFGISAEKKNIPDRYKAGPISSIYVMQDEMTQLRSENEAYKAKLDKQQSEIDALKAAVDQLLASKA